MCTYRPKGKTGFDTDLRGMSMALRIKRLREVMKWVLVRKERLDNFQNLFTAPEVKASANYREAKFPVFELFWWHRVVFDEFHESESWEYNRVRELTKALCATNRWGLSGTPPLGSSEAVADVAELMGYPDLCGAACMRRRVEIRNKPHWAYREELSSDSHQTGLRHEAQEFVDGYVRQNSSELVEAIRVVEHTELVEHTPEERVIYRQACHDHGIFDLSQSYDHVCLKVREALLQRCTHFSLRQDRSESMASAVQHLGDAKRERITAVERQLRVEAGRAVVFKTWPGAGQEALQASAVQHPGATAFLAELCGADVAVLQTECWESGLQVDLEMFDQNGHARMRPEVKLRQTLRESEYYANANQRHAVLHAVAKMSNKVAARALSELQVCDQACRGQQAVKDAIVAGLACLANFLDAAHRSFQFYEAQMRGICGNEGASTEECSICLDEMDDPRSLALLPCAHVFHSSCLRDVIAQRSKCPHCNLRVEAREVASVVMELGAQKSARQELTPLQRAHGSKLNAVADRLRQIRQEDPAAQVIVFVQWAALEFKVAAALNAHGLATSQLQMQRSKGCGLELQQFQDGQGPWILILSLEHAASGANLTAAGHVLLVHPMNAGSVATARAYERQAIGRVRRVGQTRSEVHVWRFVSQHTVEEHISKLHQQAGP
ncbi:unnamed protein product [Polarella glacialis]|uniref:RING-type domain-containing protein n=1 Tax=Polarella glacialis TaxID=89957 RepID=A0A813ITA9_POLGL|nr:unnamed protein product [Polarella glacialis]